MQPSVPILGLTGGVASGKSYVARLAEPLGAAVVDADRLAHEVLRRNDVQDAARRRWGDKIFTADGQIDRRRLADIVFAPTAAGREELAALEQLVHPLMSEPLARRIDELRERPGVRAIVIDAPLLIESGWNGFCDKIVYVEAPREVRLARARARGWNQEDFDRREARQESLEVKRRLADVVIDNSGSPESSRASIESAWRSLLRPAPPAE